MAVSKTRKEQEIKELFDAGQRVFGENRARELIVKASLLPGDIQWHLIGHLQTNKVKHVLPYVACIQSLDSARLWKKIHEEAVEINLQIRCLLQIKVAREESKYGWDYEELLDFLRSGHHLEMSNVVIDGVMGMASLTEDTDLIRSEMRQLKSHFDALQNEFFSGSSFDVVSMGMSGDYQIALEEGSTMIRVGSLLFE